MTFLSLVPVSDKWLRFDDLTGVLSVPPLVVNVCVCCAACICPVEIIFISFKALKIRFYVQITQHVTCGPFCLQQLSASHFTADSSVVVIDVLYLLFFSLHFHQSAKSIYVTQLYNFFVNIGM